MKDGHFGVTILGESAGTSLEWTIEECIISTKSLFVEKRQIQALKYQYEESVLG